MSERNHLLRSARERTRSRRLPDTAMSRQELAETVNAWLHENTGRSGALDAHYIARLERGSVRWPNEDYRAGFRAILDALNDADLGFSPRTQVAQRAPSSGLQAVPGTTGMVEPWELADTLTRCSIGNATLDHMERAVSSYAMQYPSTPPRVLLPAIEGQMRRLRGALDHPQHLRVRQRAIVLLGRLSGLAGNIWLDLDRQDRATSFFDVGELAAEEAEDSDLTAWVLATRSIGLFFAGQHRQTVALLSRARRSAVARSSSPRRRAWMTALSARARAAAGDRKGSLESLERAYWLMDQVAEPPSGTEFFDLPRLDGMAGATYLLVADTDRAAALLFKARDNRATHDAKGRALLTLDLAECHVVSREPDEAARLVVEALETAQGVLVGPILARTRSVVAGLGEWAGSRVVLELDSRLAELTRG